MSSIFKLQRPLVLSTHSASEPNLASSFSIHCVIDQPAAGSTAPSAAKTVVLSHGIFVDSRIYDRQISALTQAGFRCIRFDHRGQGQSAIPPEIAPDVPFDIDTLKADMIDLIEKTASGERVHLVGHSMGGMVAMRVAFERPELVASLTLLASNTAAGQRSFGSLLALKLFSCFGPRRIAHSVVKSLFGATFVQSPDRVEERQMWLEHVSSLTSTAISVSKGLMERPAFEAQFAQIKAPILVVAGTEDKGAGPSVANALGQLQPSAVITIIDRAGHAPQMEQSAAVNEALLNFIAKL